MATATQKFQLTNTPALPATCIACGRSQSSARDFFVDFNFSMDYYGAVIFCIECIKEAYRAVEEPVADTSVQEALEAERELNDELNERLARINSVLNSALGVDNLDAVLGKVEESRINLTAGPAGTGTIKKPGLTK